MNARVPLIRRIPLLAVAVLSVLSCEETMIDPPVASTIQLSPTSATLTAVGTTIQLAAVTLDQNGVTMPTASVVWSSSNGSVASVDSDGLVTALANGTTLIHATVGAVSASVPVIVAQQVTAVEIVPPSDTLAVGETIQLVATATDANQRPVTEALFSWESSDAAVARVDQNGLVYGISGGTVTISAEAGGVTAPAEVVVEVLPPASVVVSPGSATLVSLGQTAQLAAAAFNRNHELILDAAITWTSSDGTVATVNGAGLVTALANGATVITATAGTVSATATITVVQQVTSVTVTPSLSALVVEETAQLVAAASDANGRTVAEAAVIWRSTSPTVARVDQSGLVTAASAGTVTVTAEAGGVTGRAQVTVEALPPASIAISPSSATLASLTQTVQLEATVYNRNQEAISGVAVTWASSNGAVASVDQAGLVTALANGSAVITARAGTLSTTATVTVAQQAASVSISPSEVTLIEGDSAQLAASASDAYGRSVEGASFIWASGRPAVATVDEDGRIIAVGRGTAVVTASSGEVSGSATIFVEPPPVASLTITPVRTTLFQSGDTVQLTAVARNSAGEVLSVDINWSSSNSVVASVNAQGLVTAGQPGSAQIFARAGSITASASVIVSEPVAGVDILPAQSSLAIGDSLQLSATARDAANNVVPIPITWSSSDPAVAIVSQQGLVHALTAGTVVVTAQAGGQTGTALISVSASGFGSATPVTMGDSVGADIENQGDEHYYIVTVEGDATKDYRLTAYTEGTTDTQGRLYDSEEKELAYDDESGAGNNFRIVRMVEPGEYYVKVSGYRSETGPYTFKVDDHGDSFETATPVLDSVPGTLSEAGNVDYFRITVNVAGDLIVGTSGNLDTYGMLYDSRGTVLDENDDAGGDFNFLIERSVDAGTYYVAVSGYLGQQTGDYVFRVEGADTGDQGSGTNSNHSRLTAAALPLGGSTSDTLRFNGQDDYFVVSVPRSSSSDSVRLTVFTEGDTYVQGQLFETADSVIAADNPASKPNFLMSAYVDGGGIYFVRVRGQTSNQRGPYLLKADDHGDTQAAATPVTSLMAGNLLDDDNVDYFVIESVVPQNMRVFTTGSTDTYGEVLDEDGNLLDADDNSGEGLNFRSDLVAVRRGGTYFVRVTGGGGIGGDYEFQVEFSSRGG